MWFIGEFSFPSCQVFSAHEVLVAIFVPSFSPSALLLLLSLFFFPTDVFQCDGCLLRRGSRLGCAVVPVLGALFQSRGWLPKVEAPGYSRPPTSSLAVQLLIMHWKLCISLDLNFPSILCLTCHMCANNSLKNLHITYSLLHQIHWRGLGGCNSLALRDMDGCSLWLVLI